MIVHEDNWHRLDEDESRSLQRTYRRNQEANRFHACAPFPPGCSHPWPRPPHVRLHYAPRTHSRNRFPLLTGLRRLRDSRPRCKVTRRIAHCCRLVAHSRNEVALRSEFQITSRARARVGSFSSSARCLPPKRYFNLRDSPSLTLLHDVLDEHRESQTLGGTLSFTNTMTKQTFKGPFANGPVFKDLGSGPLKVRLVIRFV